jgi:ATP-dependent helicase/DNAse subunit B
MTLREALRRGDWQVRLLAPTATMAQHRQHALAREGLVFRPGVIQTLSRFVDAFAGTPQVSGPLLYLLVEAAARRTDRPEFAQVVELPGFCAALARTMQEFWSAGCDAERLRGSLRNCGAPLGEAFLAVFQEVEKELARRALATRPQRLLEAARRISRDGLGGIHTVWLEGFYALPDPELALIRALGEHAQVIEEPPTLCPPARTEVCEAPAIEREADEIARRILRENAGGRPFREMAVIVRSPETYAAILRATFERFGIPARFYFDAALEQHALARYLAGAVEAMLGGWDHAATLAVLRLAPDVTLDEFDFAVRRELPGAGLAKLKRLAADAPAAADLIASLEILEEWRGVSLVPADWAARWKTLRELFQPQRPEPGDRETAAIWRSRFAVLELFAGALEEAAKALAAEPVPLSVFWRAAQSAVRLTPLRLEDRRRNVVHVLSAQEARQWRLPVVFVCGLVEKQFPQFHAQDPFFPESARAHLNQAGMRLRTAVEAEAEERFLFDCAVTRATESVTLTYPRFDARGQQNLRSMFLEGLPAAAAWQPVRPAARAAPGVTQPAAALAIPGLRVFQPTALECYLQCPFQFFGRHTLKLQGAPVRPEERLDARTEGSIIHGVLAEVGSQGALLDEVFDRVFRRICERERIAPGYRTEACRLRMLRDLRALAADASWPGEGQTRTEQKFQYELREGIEIQGRIDRLDVLPDGRALVIDYKYSGAQNTRKLVDDQTRLQPQLYLLALERSFGLRAAGMLYCGLRGGVQWSGWKDGGRPIPPQWPRPAVEATLRIVEEIRAGKVAPQPADLELCGRCDYRDVCRFEAAAAMAGGG